MHGWVQKINRTTQTNTEALDRIETVLSGLAELRILTNKRAPFESDIHLPSRLLMAEHAEVAFFGREDYLQTGVSVTENNPQTGQQTTNDFAGFLPWLESEGRLKVRALHGAGGMGKTRLLMELVARASGWTAGFLDLDKVDHPKDQLAGLLSLPDNILIVIDYGEQRPDMVRLVLEAMRARANACRSRLVLLSRGDGWLEDLKGGGDTAASILKGPAFEVLPLTPLADTPETRAALFESALTRFRGLLTLDGDAAKAPDFTGDDFNRALFILAAAFAAAHGKTVRNAADALAEILGHEIKYWKRRAVERDGTFVPDPAHMRVAVALTTMAGGLMRAEAEEIFAKAPYLDEERSLYRTQLIGLLADLYPGRGDFIMPLLPDLIGEELVFETLNALEGDAVLALAFAETRTDIDLINAFATLTRLFERRKQAEPYVAVAAGLLSERLAEDRGPMLASSLHSLVPEKTLVLSELAVALMETEVARRRAALDGTDETKSALAGTLNDLGNRYSDLGRREEALSTTEEAVEIRRALAAARPDAFRPVLAASIDNLGVFFSVLGRHEEALAATEEAVTIYRALAAARPDAFLPDLATSLNNLGNRYSELGRREDALTAMEEAVEIFRALAAARPDAFRPDLATSLNNLGMMYSNLGRREEAFAVTEEAVDIYRALADARPDAFRLDLAKSLNNISVDYSNLGRHEDALAASEEAVDIYRALATARPDAFRPDLATSLNNLGVRYSALGRREEALAASEEAVEIYRALAVALPDAFRPDLATSLNNLGDRLKESERMPEALVAYREAVELLAGPFVALPQAFVEQMEYTRDDYIAACEALGEEPDMALLGPIVEVFKRLEGEE